MKFVFFLNNTKKSFETFWWAARVESNPMFQNGEENKKNLRTAPQFLLDHVGVRVRINDRVGYTILSISCDIVFDVFSEDEWSKQTLEGDLKICYGKGIGN